MVESLKQLASMRACKFPAGGICEEFRFMSKLVIILLLLCVGCGDVGGTDVQQSAVFNQSGSACSVVMRPPNCGQGVVEAVCEEAPTVILFAQAATCEQCPNLSICT